MSTVTLDGRMGEGGGQVLRTALSAAILTGRTLHITNIRGGRHKTGLLRQHLACIRAAVVVSGGHAVGAELTSETLTFTPGAIQSGRFHIDVGSAGSANLVLQTVLPALLMTDAASTLVVTGGTHNRAAPPTDCLQHSFLPALAKMGAHVTLDLDRYGFEPVGGGQITATVTPTALRPLTLVTAAEPGPVEAVAILSGMNPGIGRRLVHRACTALGWDPAQAQVRTVASAGPGGVLRLRAGGVQSTGFCVRRVRADTVADTASQHLIATLAAKAPVDAHLADQLLLPMVLAGGGWFRSVAPTLHTTTNADVIRAFYSVNITFTETDGATTVRVQA